MFFSLWSLEAVVFYRGDFYKKKKTNKIYRDKLLFAYLILYLTNWLTYTFISEYMQFSEEGNKICNLVVSSSITRRCLLHYANIMSAVDFYVLHEATDQYHIVYMYVHMYICRYVCDSLTADLVSIFGSFPVFKWYSKYLGMNGRGELISEPNFLATVTYWGEIVYLKWTGNLKNL